MTKNNPMCGLLTLTYFKTRSKILGGIIYSLVLGAAFLLSDIEMLKGMFVMSCMIYLPLQALVGMSENEGKWERFQVSLPIKRGYLLKAQFASLVFTVLIGAIILTVGIGASTVLHEMWFNDGFTSALLSSLHSYGLAFMAIGLCYLLSFIVGNFAAWMIAMLVPTIVQFTLTPIAEWLDIPIYALSAAALVCSILIFIASYFAMKKLFKTYDF